MSEDISRSILLELLQPDIYRKKICKNLSIKEANKLRQVLRLERLECSYRVNDKDQQISVIPYVDTLSTQVFEIIERVGTFSMIQTIFHKRDVAILRTLLEFGLDPNVTITYSFRTGPLLAQIAEVSPPDLMRVLIEFGANVEGRGDNALTPLMYAAIGNNYEGVKLLLDAGADINAEANGWTALTHALNRAHREIVDELIRRGVNLFTPGRSPGHNLMLAVQLGWVDLVEYFIDHGIDVNIQTAQGSTPLIKAVTLDRIPVVKLLLEKGADPRIPNRNGISALDAAEGDPLVIKLLEEAIAKF